MAPCNASLHICMHFEKGASAVIRILEQSHIERTQNCAEIFQKKSPNFIRTKARHFDNLMSWLVRLESIK